MKCLNEIDLSIVIVAWNAREFVLKCLASLEQTAGKLATETILVDNGSSDGTPEVVRAHFPSVKIVTNTENQGFAKGSNTGIVLSTGEYVCLVNSDVVVDPHCMKEMHSFMVKNPRVGMVGPRMRTPDGGVGRSYMRFPSVWRCLCRALALDMWLPGCASVAGFLMRDFDNAYSATVDVLNGWFVMVKRKALDEVGPLDERFFMYGEDLDWSYRFCRAGWERVYFAGAESFHYGGASSAVAPVRFYLEMQRANLQFWRKHYGLAEVGMYISVVCLHETIRVIGYAATFVFSKSRRSVAVQKIARSVACLRWLIVGGVVRVACQIPVIIKTSEPIAKRDRR